MIAAFLTFLCIVCISADEFSSPISWVLIGVIAMIWFTRMVWIDDAVAHINWVVHWSKDDRERALEQRRWEEEARADAGERARREASERMRREKEICERIRAEYERKAHAEAHTPTVICDRCGSGARQVHRIKYPSGTTYVEYQCPRCAERRLKKVA